MIQFLNVTKIYNVQPEPIIALDDISFTIQEGEFVFLVGPSGSGKTTILRQIIREELPTKGKIFFDDVDITKLKRHGVYKLRRKIGIVFQDYKLIEHKNAYENVAFAMEAAGQTAKEIKETVPYVLDIVNLSSRAHAFPSQLSGGEKQRIAIARAIANNPSVLIADEPTGNLDPESSWDIVQILAKINKWGTTVIMSTHGTEIVNSLKKRVLKMDKGKLVRDEASGSYSDSLKAERADAANDSSDESNDQDETIVEVLEESKSEVIQLPAPGSEGIRLETLGDSDKEEDGSTDKEISVETTKDSKNAEVSDEVQTAMPAPTETSAVEVAETLANADTVSLKNLKLTTKLQSKLNELGYHDVEDILTAGVASVNQKLNKTEIRQLAKAIKRYLTTE